VLRNFQLSPCLGLPTRSSSGSPGEEATHRLLLGQESRLLASEEVWGNKETSHYLWVGELGDEFVSPRNKQVGSRKWEAHAVRTWVVHGSKGVSGWVIFSESFLVLLFLTKAQVKVVSGLCP
jgi:hypothetical protein